MRGSGGQLLARLLPLVARHGAAASGALEAGSSASAGRLSIAAGLQLDARHFSTEGQQASKGGQPAGKQPKPKQPPAAQQPNKPQQQQHAAQQGKPRSAQQPKEEEAPERPWYSGADVAQLATVPVGKYFDVAKTACPEATKQYYADPSLADERVNQPNYGCKAVQAELATFPSSQTLQLLQRRCIQQLQEAVEGRQRGRIFLEGWTGSGKSVALYALVNWARQNGWLVLYIPSAFMMVEGGTFFKGEDGLWDTPDAARLILNMAMDNHGSLLKELHGSNGQPLSKLVSEGLGAKAPRDVVEAAIKLKEELLGLKEVPVLLAVDDYNALYSRTGYQEAVHAFHARDITTDELRLARAFRLLEQPAPANGVTVAAPTYGQTVSDKLRIPLPKGSRMHVPRYSLDEVSATAEYFTGTGHIAGSPAEDILKRALFLTNGNARELREFSATLLHEDDPLGLSLGYKAKASRLQVYMETVV